ncbi:Lysophospholipase, alpha-beta hydrolase superfamily [Methylomagnum ishizawai]|uniref:Lysophospholipase, alpha-beta hydrolase superfamily n=1 Tax=Methylomagnum ishizawai TaxID=1760988 RepID=A0A1Y6D0D8_9GAMM|nr:alpha/beta fold hydrolase [Methylomagnum ishizawai]SMF96398.1 Lysophospholipase, alpha-beta hydrolase superfamily [Methylomagnum ishizawai]
MRLEPMGLIPSRLIFKLAGSALALAAAFSAAALWRGAGELAQPKRKAIQDYQRDWLEHPAAHGISLHHGACDDGQAPCLFVAPDPATTPAQRGTRLREQLAVLGTSPKPYGQTSGILVLLHGRNGRKEDLLPVAERFAAAGFMSVIPDLPAHGESPIEYLRFATAPDERGIVAHALKDARRFFQAQDAPAALWGMSMGGAFATRAALDAPHLWRALVIVASFDRLENVVEDQLAPLPPALLPPVEAMLADWMRLRGGADLRSVRPDTWANRVALPVFMAHGDADRLIPLRRGRSLFEAFASPDKTWTSVPGGDHYNVLVTAMPLYAKMSAWLLAHCGQDNAAPEISGYSQAIPATP